MSAITSTHPLSPTTARQAGWRRLGLRWPDQGAAFGLIIVLGLAAFEIFNFSTTQFALADLLGDLRLARLSLATVLALAFSGIDFGGIARLFTPQRDQGDRIETWYLVAAWVLAGGMNAILTWWAVTLSLMQQADLGHELFTRRQVLTFVPVFVAGVVWLIRILLIGTLTMGGRRLFSQARQPAPLTTMAQVSPRVARRTPTGTKPGATDEAPTSESVPLAPGAAFVRRNNGHTI
jgi:hypothetical protein